MRKRFFATLFAALLLFSVNAYAAEYDHTLNVEDMDVHWKLENFYLDIHNHEQPSISININSHDF